MHSVGLHDCIVSTVYELAHGIGWHRGELLLAHDSSCESSAAVARMVAMCAASRIPQTKATNIFHLTTSHTPALISPISFSIICASQSKTLTMSFLGVRDPRYADCEVDAVFIVCVAASGKHAATECRRLRQRRRSATFGRHELNAVRCLRPFSRRSHLNPCALVFLTLHGSLPSHLQAGHHTCTLLRRTRTIRSKPGSPTHPDVVSPPATESHDTAIAATHSVGEQHGHGDAATCDTEH